MMNKGLTSEGFKGRWLHKQTSEIFALKIVKVIDPEYGHTHQLKNESHFRSCTGKEFNEQFEQM